MENMNDDNIENISQNGDSQDFIYEDFYSAYKSVQRLKNSFNQIVPNLSISSDGLEGLDLSSIDGCNPCLSNSCGVNNNLNALESTFSSINEAVISSDESAKTYFEEHEKMYADIDNFAEEMVSKLDEKFDIDEETRKNIKEAIKNEYSENPKAGFRLFTADEKHTLEELAQATLADQHGYTTPEERYNAMLAVVISESNKTPDEVVAITSALLNRCDIYDNWVEDKGTNNPFDQLFATKKDGSAEFEAITKDGGRYKDYIPDNRENGVESINEDLESIGAGYTYDELKQAFDDAYFGGLRNNIYSSYWSGWADNQSIRAQYDSKGGNNQFFNNIANPTELATLKSEAEKRGIKTFQL